MVVILLVEIVQQQLFGNWNGEFGTNFGKNSAVRSLAKLSCICVPIPNTPVSSPKGARKTELYN